MSAVPAVPSVPSAPQVIALNGEVFSTDYPELARLLGQPLRLVQGSESIGITIREHRRSFKRIVKISRTKDGICVLLRVGCNPPKVLWAASTARLSGPVISLNDGDPKHRVQFQLGAR